MSWLSRATMIVVVACTAVLVSCADANRLAVYRAERMLFKADKRKAELANSMVPARSEFFVQAIQAYRDIVAQFNGYAGSVDGIEVIVLTAQLSLARLELETGRIADARDDFLYVLEIERTVPDARMDALFGAARISEQIKEPERAFELYLKFYVDYLSLEDAARTARKQPVYLDAPLKLAALCRRIDRQYEEALWLQTAETLFEYLIAADPGPEVVKTARFKLLATLLEQAKWDDALELSRSLTGIYRDDESRTALLLLEARVHQTGKHDGRRAEDLYRHIYEQYPTASEAPDAMLAHAALRASQRDTVMAARLYNRVLDTYSRHPDIAAQAEWQLALMEEHAGEWLDASLRYKAISKQYAGTQPAFDAPLRLAAGYKRMGADEAADGVYQRAVGEYRKIADGQHPLLARLTAEDYILQVLTLQKRWEDAVQHLIAVADRYSSFERMHFNYITAAEIYRTELNDERRSAETLVACIERFPNTDAAREAQQRLGPLNAGQ